jgi:hypothetical protein
MAKRGGDNLRGREERMVEEEEGDEEEEDEEEEDEEEGTDTGVAVVLVAGGCVI